MSRTRTLRTVAALAATGVLVAAGLAGTADAGALITGAQVKDGSLSGRDLATGALTGADVRDGSLTQRDVTGSLRGPAGVQGARGSTGPAGGTGRTGPVGPSGPIGALGPEGPRGSTGVQGPTGVRGLTYELSAGTAVGPGGLVTIRVPCHGGRLALSGGVGTYGNPKDLLLVMSAPFELRDGWTVIVANPGTTAVTEYAWATCAHAY